MRILLGLFALAPLALQFCGASDEPPPPPSLAGAPAVTASAAITLPAASHGGTVLAVEDRPVEVVVASDGQVNAWLPGPPPPPNTTLSVQVNTVAGPKMTTLQWNATTAVFEGEVVGSAPAPGPIEVGLTFDGRLRHGHANRVVVVRQRHPRAHVDVRVQAPQPPQPRANVNVQINAPEPPRPQFNVQINGPRPPSSQIRVEVRGPRPPSPQVRVEVRGPRPPMPGVRVEVHEGMDHHDNGRRDHGEGHGRDHGRDHGMDHGMDD